MPDGTIAEFPEDMPQDKIQSALQSHFAPKRETSPSFPPQEIVQYDRVASDRAKANEDAEQKVRPRQTQGEEPSAPEILWQSANTPATTLLSPENREQVKAAVAKGLVNSAFGPVAGAVANEVIDRLPEGTLKSTVKGAGEGVGDLAQSFSSPVGLATTLVKAPQAVQRILSAVFAYTSGKGVTEEVKPLAEAIEKKDWETATRLGIGILGGATIAGTAGAHALAPGLKPVPPVITDAARVLPKAAEQAKTVLQEPAEGTEPEVKNEDSETVPTQKTEAAEVPKPTENAAIMPAAAEEAPVNPPAETTPGLEETLSKPESFKGKNWTKDALEYGAGLDPAKPDQYEQLKQLEAKYAQELKDIPKTIENFDRISQVGNRKQWVTEARQAAEGLSTRDVARDVLGKDYQPPFPLGKAKEAGEQPARAEEAPATKEEWLAAVKKIPKKPLTEQDVAQKRRIPSDDIKPVFPASVKAGDELINRDTGESGKVESVDNNFGKFAVRKEDGSIEQNIGINRWLFKSELSKFLKPKEASKAGEQVSALPIEKPSGFRPPEQPKEFKTLDDLLSYRDKYKQSEIEFYKSLGLDDADAQKMFRSGDNRSNLDTEKIESKLTPENREKLEQFSTGEGSEMYQWDRMFDPSRIKGQTDASELASGLVGAFGKEGLSPGLDDKFIFSAASLRQLKENGGTWSDVARALDAFTTRNSGSQSDKAFLFKDIGQKLRNFATTQGIELNQGELGSRIPSTKETTAIGAGPGAATRPGAVLQTDIGQFESNIPPLEKLADAVKSFPKQVGGGFKEKLRQWMDDVGIPAKDFAARAVVGAKAATAKVVDAFTNLPKVTTMDRAVGDWNLADTEGDIAARRFSEAVKKTFPDRSKLRALSNWINAGGDRELLTRQAALTKDPALKKTYEDAMRFGPAEEKLAREVRQYHDEMLATAMQAGALEEGLENYIHRYYPKESDPTRKKLEADLNVARFTKNFAGFKKRFYDSDFEAEQAGLKPEKDAAKRILAYDQGFRKALTARAFVKDRYQATMPDGRPEIDVTGVGVPSKTNAETGKEGPYLIKPKSKVGGDSAEDYRGDYVTFDHPAFRKWKWVGEDNTGKPILMEGEMAVHPDAVKKYKALFESSWFQKNPIGKALLAPSNFVKQTMLAVSAFHPVQIGIHAIEHKTNPFNLVDLNTRDPAQAELIKGGLVVSDLGGANHFSEGVGGSGLFGKLPIVGEMTKASQDWLFKDFIPRIKMTMGLDALERNRKTYAKDVAAGKITDEQLVRLTAREANAAFGEQNYRAMFRHKGFQDLLRFAFLAPDFGEARLRFPAQALTKYGGEQRMALLLGAVGMFVAAKSAEKMMTGEMKLDPKHWFNVTYKGKEYGLRNVASDLMHMITDPSGYLRNRLNPIYTRAALEMLSGRDAFGRKRDAKQQALDEAKQIVPISGRGFVEKDQSAWEGLINAIGLTEHRASAFGSVMKDVNAWKEKKGYTNPGEFVYDADKDQYAGLTRKLTFGDVADARKALDKLTDGKTPAQARKIAEHYRRSLKDHQFLTGSRAHEAEYVKGLSASEKSQYDAAKAERAEMWDKFVKAYRSKYPPKEQ